MAGPEIAKTPWDKYSSFWGASERFSISWGAKRPVVGAWHASGEIGRGRVSLRQITKMADESVPCRHAREKHEADQTQNMDWLAAVITAACYRRRAEMSARHPLLTVWLASKHLKTPTCILTYRRVSGVEGNRFRFRFGRSKTQHDSQQDTCCISIAGASVCAALWRRAKFNVFEVRSAATTKKKNGLCGLPPSLFTGHRD